MSDYDSAAVRRMASILEAAATVTLVLFGLSGAVTTVSFGVVGSRAVGDGAGLFWLGGLVYGALVFGVGYLIALFLRVVAQLMLAVVQIESNTRQTPQTVRVPSSVSAAASPQMAESPGLPIEDAAVAEGWACRCGQFNTLDLTHCPACGRSSAAVI